MLGCLTYHFCVSVYINAVGFLVLLGFGQRHRYPAVGRPSLPITVLLFSSRMDWSHIKLSGEKHFYLRSAVQDRI